MPNLHPDMREALADVGAAPIGLVLRARDARPSEQGQHLLRVEHGVQGVLVERRDQPIDLCEGTARS